ncbi:hypothetical protein [Caldilinea sp.]|uniref:hypothetical protein n=1 Tax=Caldilinea sp. TaxID=2293560 RepID=UPI00257C3D85|nr:hypothetical protein [Caldilinea sp.]
MRSALEPLLNVPQKMMFDYIASIESSVSPIPPPDAPGHADLINNVYWPLVIDPFMFGQQSAEDAVRILREEASVVLAAAAR